MAVEWIPERWSGDPLTGFLDAFDRAYLRLYGYRPEGRAIEIVSLRVVASSRGEPDPALPEPRERGIVEARSRQRAFVGSGWGEVAVHERTDLVPGDRLVGPALFVEAHATTWIVGGWHGRVLADGALLLETG